MKTFQEFIAEAKRIKVLNTAHYTTKERKEKILNHGFKSGGTGAYHPRDDEHKHSTVYTTPSSRVGNDYGKSKVNLRIVNPKVHTTSMSQSEYSRKFKNSSEDEKKKLTSPNKESQDAIKSGSKVVKVKDAHKLGYMAGGARGSYIMVDKEVANKSINRNPSPTVRAKNKETRTKTQPKKKT